MQSWAHERLAMRRLIEPGKRNQNAHIESFKVRLHDACLNEHWFSPWRMFALRSRRSVVNETGSDRRVCARRDGARRLCSKTGKQNYYIDCRTLKPTTTKTGAAVLLSINGALKPRWRIFYFKHGKHTRCLDFFWQSSTALTMTDRYRK